MAAAEWGGGTSMCASTHLGPPRPPREARRPRDRRRPRSGLGDSLPGERDLGPGAVGVLLAMTRTPLSAPAGRGAKRTVRVSAAPGAIVVAVVGGERRVVGEDAVDQERLGAAVAEHQRALPAAPTATAPKSSGRTEEDRAAAPDGG